VSGLLDLYTAVGRDRYVVHSEAGLDSTPHGRRIWDVYDRHFGRFTGVGLDPQFTRLRHAGRRFSLPRFEAGVRVMAVGCATLDPELGAALAAERDGVVVMATPAGAVALASCRLHADIVVVEPHDDGARWDEGPLDPRTTWLVDRAIDTSAVTTGVPVRVAPALPSWGSPLATVVALALDAGATAVGIVGASGETPLRALLDLLAVQAPGRLALVDQRGPAELSPAAGWTRWAAGDEHTPAPTVIWDDHGSGARLIDEARADLALLTPLLPDARAALDAALAARDGQASSRAVLRGVEMLLAWGADPCVRWSVQHGLGLAFLPRLWRSGISLDPSTRPWRPLVLGLHELIDQTARLSAALPPADVVVTQTATGRRTSSATAPPVPSRVTVIVTALGTELTGLREAVTSLTAQTHADLEVIVVHDHHGSAAVHAVVRDLDARVRRLLVVDSSIGAALNEAIEVASGDFIAHHDVDGLSHPQRLARQAAFLGRHPEIDVVAVTTVVSDAGGGPPRVLCHAGAHTPEALARLLPEACPIEHGSVLVRRAAIVGAGGYRDGAPRLDHDLWRRLLPTSRFAKLPTQLYARRASLTRDALAPAGARDRHAPAGAEGALADSQPGRGLAALELGQPHEA
jgi:hypothetical protein